jgi:uncharacterized repeat protein (TIGR03803 family)
MIWASSFPLIRLRQAIKPSILSHVQRRAQAWAPNRTGGPHSIPTAIPCMGGHHGYGVVFSFDTSTNTYMVLHDFAGGASDGATTDHGYVVQVGNVLYGMTTNGGASKDGVIFSIGTDGSNFQLLHTFPATCHAGKHPYGSLLLVGNQLYGTTASRGDNGAGTLFVINTDGSGYNRLHSFGSTKHEGN